MISMLIYEPDKIIAERLREGVRRIFTQVRCNLNLLTHTSVEPIMTKLTQNPHMFDIAVLPCDAKGQSIASLIRKNSLSAALIFVGGGDALLGTLAFRPSGHICLPIDFSNLKTIISRLIKEQTMHNRSFVVRTKEKIVRIPYGDIDCIESSGRNCTVLTTSGVGECTFIAKLDDVGAKLPENIFVRSHQSCIVNITNAVALDRTTHRFTMRSGHFADISKRNYTQIAEIFENYI